MLAVGLPTRAEAQMAQPDTLRVTLEEARQRALASNPTYLARHEEPAIARGALRQARLLDNPQAEFEAPSAIDEGDFGEYEARLTQRIEWAGQRGLRIDAAGQALARARAEVGWARSRLLADVTRAWAAVRGAAERVELVAEVNTLNDRLAEAVRIQAAEGEISEMEANLGGVAVGRARARFLATRQDLVRAQVELARLMGLESSPAIIAAPDTSAPAPSVTLDELPDLVAQSLERRAELTMFRASVAEARARARLAGREAIPALEIGGLAGSEGDGGMRFGIVVGSALPLWNRNQGTAEQRRAELRQAEYELAAAEQRVRAEVTDAFSAYLATAEALAILERDVRPTAHTTQEMLATAYEAGRIDLSTLVLLRNELLDAELDYWAAWLTHQSARADLELATGTIDDVPEEMTDE